MDVFLELFLQCVKMRIYEGMLTDVEQRRHPIVDHNCPLSVDDANNRCLYSQTILKNILSLFFLQDLQIGMLQNL